MTGITINWLCKDIIQDSPCRTLLGDLVVMNNTLENNFPKKLFLPFSTLEFTLAASKSTNGKTDSTKIIVIIIENG